MRKKIYSLAIVVYVLDLASKLIVLGNGRIYYNKEVIQNFFYIYLSRNDGGAFSIFPGSVYLLAIIAIIALVFIDRKFIKEDLNKLQWMGISFLIGGIVGNLIDRIFRGAVIDFLSFIIFDYHMAIFNIADIFIVLGASIIILDLIRSEINENKSRRKEN